MMKAIKLLVTICTLCSCWGCVKNEYIIDDYRGSGDIDWNGKRHPVFFSPKLETSYTRSVDVPFPKGTKAKIYALTNATNKYIGAKSYQCQTAGVLSSTSPLMLPYGSYNFYGASSLNNSNPPSFSNNVATGLVNGVDYVWGCAINHDINSPSNTVPITFYHQAIQLQFTINNVNDKVQVTSINDNTQIGASENTSSARWDFRSGKISQITASSYTYITGSQLTIDGLTVRGICLPFTSSANCPVTINAKNNNNDEISLQLSVPLPEGGYVGGSSYNYNVVYAPDSVYLEGVLVLPWKEVVEKPITVP